MIFNKKLTCRAATGLKKMTKATASVSALLATLLASDPRYEIIRQQGHGMVAKTALMDMAYVYAYARDPESGVRVIYNNIQYNCDRAMARAKRDGTIVNGTMACPGRLGPVGVKLSSSPSYTEMMSTAPVSSWSPTASLPYATPTLPASPLKNPRGQQQQGVCYPKK